MNGREYKPKDSNKSEMRHVKEPLKNVELRLVSELMKNSRRSDRELAKAIGVSQPTVSRLIAKLEKLGVIREYTAIPDFRALGYNIMGITSLEVSQPVTEEKFKEIRKVTLEISEKDPHPALMAVNGLSQKKNRVFISFYKDYADYMDTMKTAKQMPHVNANNVESFLVDLNDETNYRLLRISAIARSLRARLEKKMSSHE